jgi:hypothetical protein
MFTSMKHSFFKRHFHKVGVFLRTKNFCSKIGLLSMHVCKATIQDFKTKYFKNSELFPDFMRNFFRKNGRVLWAKLQFFVVPPKFDQNNFFQKFKKNLVRYFTINTWKSGFLPVVYRDSRPPGARESMSMAIFHWVKLFLTNFFLNFWKKLFWSNFGRTTKNWSFAQKTLPFFKKNSQKSGKSSGFLKYFF